MSKVTVEAKAFQAALARVTGAIKPQKNYPILQCVRISAADGEMQITGTDLDVVMMVTLPASGAMEAICTDFSRLGTIAGTLKDRGEMTIEAGNDSAVIACGRSRFTVGLMASDMWPELTVENWETQFSVSGSRFARLMTALAPAISEEETRYYLNGIFLRPGSVVDDRDDGSLLGVATDGHKLLARSIEVDGIPAKMKGIILPRFACATIGKSFGDAGMLAISCNDRKLQVAFDGVTYLTKLIEGQFPDWRRVVPKVKPALAFDRAELTAAARIAAAAKVTTKEGKAVKMSFGEGETAIDAIDLNNPAFSGSDVVKHTELSEPLSDMLGVNVDYLIEVLGELEADTIEIAPPKEPTSAPIVLRARGHDDRLAVIMSMRV